MRPQPDSGDLEILKMAFTGQEIWLAAARREDNIRLLKRVVLTVAVLSALVFGWAWKDAVAQQPHPPTCQKQQDIAKVLDQKYQESRVALGVQPNGTLVEIYSTEDGTTWTVLVTRANGWSCIVAAGKNWETVKPKNRDPLA